MNRILFPTDLSSISKNAYLYTSKFAHQLSTEITVLHAHSFQDDIRTIFLPNRDLWTKLTEFVREEDSGEMAANVSLLMRKGRPLDEIMEVSNSSQYRYIVMSKKRSYNVYRRLTGSKTTRIIKRANHPVIVIPEETDFKPIRNILVVDANYQRLARPLQEHLLLLSLRCKANLHYIDIVDDGVQWGGKQKQLHRDQLLIQKHVPADLALETIMDYVPDHEIDLVVMVTERKDLFGQLYQLSFANQKQEYREIPLLIFNKNFLKSQQEDEKTKKARGIPKKVGLSA
ncbi:MAG: universal stress protein [Bacteroidetes bacterium]|nr:universal stress protein [Bacteroidota bacterium]